MTLLDTNVPIYASDRSSPHSSWARQTIADAVAGGGAAVNAVSLAERCVGDDDPSTVAQRIRTWGVVVLDVPAAASEVAAQAYRAYRAYRQRRFAESGRPAPSMPLPDFFIGAQAMIMGWELATADEGRFRTYFASVRLRLPETPAK